MTETTGPTTGLPVNWALATRTGSGLVLPGPAVDAHDALREVERLRDGARTGEEHVRRLTGLGAGLPVPEAAVVDRPAWIASAVDGIAALTAEVPLPARGRTPGVLGRAASAATASVAGVQMGTLLAFLAARVLGQYDPFAGRDTAGRTDDPRGDGAGEGDGRLLLVAPNVTAVRTALRVDAEDFALWVCLHEATHRLQFTAVPWLREHFRAEVGRFAGGLSDASSSLAERLPEIARSLRGARGGGAASLLEMVQGPEQRAVLDRLLALTTLLEGHAEHVMDEVGPDVVPSVATIRSRFTARRRGGSLLDRLLRLLLGMEAKVRQYEQGRVFVDETVARVGMDGFNAVWTSPETLPRRAEITDPAAWVARVHG